jgi:2-dehydropantoate 2-reductase
MKNEILIWGAGAIGGVLGAYWARAGQSVTMVDIVTDHVTACRTEGLKIEGPVEEFTQVVDAVLPEDLTGTYSCVVLAVKAQATEAAVASILPHLREDGFILSAQNGLNEKMIADLAGAHRTMGAFVNYGADWIEPGRILFGNRGAVVVGEIDNVIRERTERMHKLLRIFEPDAVLTDDIWGYLWGKMGYGAMLFATALTSDSMTANFADLDRGPALMGLAREVMRTAVAEGVTPRPFNGFEPKAFMPDAADASALRSLADLADFNSRTAKTHTGIYRDLAVRKRKTEVDQQLGVMVDIAAGHGIDTPLLRRLIELIHDIEEGRRDMSVSTFHELTRVMP